ncbi:MAG: SDR family oxidoreductase [Thermoplasmata archaeon]|nr:SDR family oxidoreductase [Thermoplasmata archaeon]
MSGKVCVVTGATSGLGEATARALAAQGARVAVVGRTFPSASEAVTRLRGAVPEGEFTAFGADLLEMGELRSLASSLADRLDRVDVLVNNAGAVFHRRGMTRDGHERTFALNVLAPFRLTHLLAPQLRAATPARVVNVASAAHVGESLVLDDLESTRSYRGFRAYGRSKLALILLTHEFARRWAGSGVTVNALHPGFVATRFGQNNGGSFALMVRFVSFLAAIPVAKGVATQLYLATSPEVRDVSGEYFQRSRPARSSPASYDPTSAARLWELCAAASPGLT